MALASQVLWSTTCTIACASVRGISRVRSLTSDSPPILGAPYLKILLSRVFENFTSKIKL
jgi:hypothetical protein